LKPLSAALTALIIVNALVVPPPIDPAFPESPGSFNALTVGSALVFPVPR